jgi:anti-sigma factor RsiW
MKKTLKAALVILVMAACGRGAWASPDSKPQPHLTQAQVDQLRAQQKQRHRKKAKTAVRKVGGQALRGAKRVSPGPVKKNNP